MGRANTKEEEAFLAEGTDKLPPKEAQARMKELANQSLVIESTKGCGQTPRVVFALEELGSSAPKFELHTKPDGHFTQTYGRPGPRMLDGPLTLQESPAMLRHLARKYGRRQLLPGSLTGQAQVDEWFDFNFRLSMTFLRWMDESKRPEAERDAKVLASAQQMMESFLGVLDRHLADREWLVGSFTVADCGLVSMARIGTMFDLAKRPHLKAYLDRLTHRPAWLRAQEKIAASVR